MSKKSKKSKKRKITSAKEYRNARRHEVELPSGAVFVIRKLSPMAFTDLLNIFGDVTLTQEQATATVRENIVGIMKAIIPKCVVSPKVSFEYTEDEDVLYMEDIEPEDMFALLDAVYSFSGITAEASVERQNFREDATS